ncbi:hypothetical protein Rfer_3068 [Rhodoferax ferrireducens T118]|uniref:Uncharacterized protein n=1 Tax=Albidiferax ferrireducens (strain ATCC BAA-621 / DSM 15236 / T118) TaxID=338969 RepID=Q21TX5_ALBFT|nr:hypothetical protein Rfer_3068 [Rhodoferax ferrireducens T118]
MHRETRPERLARGLLGGGFWLILKCGVRMVSMRQVLRVWGLVWRGFEWCFGAGAGGLFAGAEAAIRWIWPRPGAGERLF